MRLTRIVLDDFMAYPHAEVDLAGVSSIAVVGENGHGKSTLLDAITWALFDRSRLPGGGEGSSPDQLIHHGAERAQVRVEWRSGTHYVAVTREHRAGGGSLQLEVDGEKRTGHTTAETRARITAYVGMDYAPLLAGPFMVQAQQYTTPTGLMQVGPAERKEIVLAAFNADIYAPLHEQAKSRWAEHDGVFRAAQARIEAIEVNLAESRDLTPEIEAAKREIAEAEAEAERLTAEHTEARAALAEMTARVEQLADLRRRSDTLTLQITESNASVERQQARQRNARAYLKDTPEPKPVDEDAIASATNRVAAARHAREEQAAARARRDQLQIQLNHAETAHLEAEALKGKVPCHGVGIYAACPLLVRDDAGDLEAIRADLAAARAEYASAEAEAAGLDEATSRLDHLTAEALTAGKVTERRAEAQKAIDEAAEEIATREAWISSATDELNEVAKRRDAISAEAERRTDQERKTTRLLLAAQVARETAHKARLPLEQIQRQQAALEHARVELAEWQRRSSEAKGEAEVYRDLADAFHRDGIPTLLINSAMPVLEAHANEILARLPGDLTVTISAGSASSDRLNVLVSANGDEENYYMLSIGQRFRIDLALRVALSRVIAARGGARVETLWLDEPLAHVDARSRAAVIEALGAIEDEFDLIVVVSHHDEFNDAFPNRLQIIQEAGVSRAELT